MMEDVCKHKNKNRERSEQHVGEPLKEAREMPANNLLARYFPLPLAYRMPMPLPLPGNRMAFRRPALVGYNGLDCVLRGQSRGFYNYPNDNTSVPSTSSNPNSERNSGSPFYVTGDSHYEAVSETNSSYRGPPWGYGDRVRHNYRSGRGPNTNARSFQRPLRAPRTDDYRHWQYALKQPPSQNERFVILSYNILADYLARDHWQQLYSHIPRHILDWDWRKRRILLELGLWSPDIMCFQEVDKFQELEKELKERGYAGLCKERTGIAIDGCAIFWRTSRFELLHEEYIEYSKLGLRDNVAQICVLESKCSGNGHAGISHLDDRVQKSEGVNRVVVCNIHVFFNPRRGEIKLGQVRVLLERAHAVSKAWDGVPIVIAGDFNCTPKSPLYNFLSRHELDISGLARNQISGQTGSQAFTTSVPIFRPNPANRNAQDLAHMQATRLQCMTGKDELTSTDEKSFKSCPNPEESPSQGSMPGDLADTSTEHQLGLGKEELVPVASTEDIFAQQGNDIAKYAMRPAIDAKNEQRKGLLEASSSGSIAMAQAANRSLTVKETKGNLCAQVAALNEEDTAFDISHPVPFWDEICPKEVEKEHGDGAGCSSQYRRLAYTPKTNHFMVVEEEGSVDSREESSTLGVKDIVKGAKELHVDDKDDHANEVLGASSVGSLVMTEGMKVSLAEVKEMSGHMIVEANVKDEASMEKENSAFNSSEAMAICGTAEHQPPQYEMCPKEVVRGQAGLVNGFQQDCLLEDKSTENHSVMLKEEMVSVGTIEKSTDIQAKDVLKCAKSLTMDVEDDSRKDLLKTYSAESPVMEPGQPLSSTKVQGASGHLSAHSTVMVKANEKEEGGVFKLTETIQIPFQDMMCPDKAKRAHAGLVGGSSYDHPCVAEDIEKTSPLFGGLAMAEDLLVANSPMFRKESQNDFSGSDGIGALDNIYNGEQSFFGEDGQTSKAIKLGDKEETAMKFDSSYVFSGESPELTRVGSSSTIGENTVKQEVEGRKFVNINEAMVNPQLAPNDGINSEIDQSEDTSKLGCREVQSAPAFDSHLPIETRVVPYDPFYWSPVEIEAATGNADCHYLQHDLKLKSAYTEVEDYAGTKDSSGEPLVTSYNRRFMGTVDYLWHTEGLQTIKVLDTLPTNILQRTRGFPTHKWGSDHLALACQLAFTSNSSTDEDHTADPR